MSKELLINILFIALAVIALGFSVWILARVKKVKKVFNAAIILIPLHYNKVWHVSLIVIDLAMIFACAICIFLLKQYIIFGALIFILVNLLIIVVALMTCRFAVLDSGIVVPFKYIDWLHVYEYKIEGNKVFFFRDHDGYDTMRAITPKLSFDSSDTEKMEFLLNKYKVNDK